MNLLLSRPKQDGIEIVFQPPGTARAFAYQVRRTVLGVSFPAQETAGDVAYGYVCVVGERMFHAERDDREPQRQYVVMDEADAANLQVLFAGVVRLKDLYLASMVFCTNAPASTVEALKRTEGISFYSHDHPRTLAERFPTYVSRQTVAAIREASMVAQDAHGGLARLLSEDVTDIATSLPVLTGGRQVAKRLTLVRDLNTMKARAGIQSADVPVCMALWLAVSGLESSRRWSHTQKTWERKVGKSGY